MTLASINFTGRQKILLEDVKLRVEEVAGGYQVSGEIDLKRFNLDEGIVVIEMYRQNYRERKSIGHVVGPDGVPRTHMEVSETFPPYSVVSVLLCDIKIVSAKPGAEGKVLAWAQSLRPTYGGENADALSKGLLPFVGDSEMGQLLWFTSFEDEQNPIVKINESITDWRSFCRTPVFQALVLPEIVRDLAQWLWKVLDQRDELSIVQQWVEVFKAFGADIEQWQEDHPDGDDSYSWSSHASIMFAEQFRMLDRLPSEIEASQ
jgi:hypothetical protein